MKVRPPKLPARIDLALVALAVTIGVPHLFFPFGRDQALAASVARAWLFDGTRPYEGSFSQHPPGLLLLHAFAALFGDTHAFPFRLLCFVAVLVTGLSAPLVLVPARSRIPPGVMGLGACAASLFAHGYFDYGDSGRGGVFVAACLTVAMALLLRASHEDGQSRRAGRVLGAGALLGVALLLRPTALVFVPLLLGVVVSGERPWSRAVRHLATFVLGAGLPIGAALLVLARGNVLSDAYDLLWDGRCTYLGAHARGALDPLFAMASALTTFEPLVAPIGFLFAVLGVWAFVDGRRDDLGRRVLVAGVALASVGAIVVERHYARFAFELLVLPVALAVSAIALDLGRLFPTATARAHLAFLAQCIFLYAVSCWEIYTPPAVYGLRWAGLTLHARGRMPLRMYEHTFDAPHEAYFPAESAEMAEWIRARAAEGDELLVRGNAHDVYVRTGLRYRGRFGSSGPLTAKGCAYKRAAWLAQDGNELRARRPRFVVVVVVDEGKTSAEPGVGKTSAEPFLPLGYTEGARTAHYIVLERPR